MTAAGVSVQATDSTSRSSRSRMRTGRSEDEQRAEARDDDRAKHADQRRDRHTRRARPARHARSRRAGRGPRSRSRGIRRPALNRDRARQLAVDEAGTARARDSRRGRRGRRRASALGKRSQLGICSASGVSTRHSRTHTRLFRTPYTMPAASASEWTQQRRTEALKLLNPPPLSRPMRLLTVMLVRVDCWTELSRLVTQ